VLEKLGSKEKPIRTRDGRWFTVRITPYRTLDDRIDGVVITFWDISVAKTLEGELRDSQSALETRVADQSATIDKAKVDLKAERKRVDSERLRRSR
jgi:two-component system CheB/CheR fusion protein